MGQRKKEYIILWGRQSLFLSTLTADNFKATLGNSHLAVNAALANMSLATTLLLPVRGA